MNKYIQTLNTLAEIAGTFSKNEYNILDTAIGYVTFKNDKNITEEVGDNFINVAKYLLSEAENSFYKKN